MLLEVRKKCPRCGILVRMSQGPKPQREWYAVEKNGDPHVCLSQWIGNGHDAISVKDLLRVPANVTKAKFEGAGTGRFVRGQ